MVPVYVKNPVSRDSVPAENGEEEKKARPVLLFISDWSLWSAAGVGGIGRLE